MPRKLAKGVMEGGRYNVAYEVFAIEAHQVHEDRAKRIGLFGFLGSEVFSFFPRPKNPG